MACVLESEKDFFAQGLSTLVSNETAMNSIKEHYTGLENTIMQRLKWAAGANPTLQTVMQQLNDALEENRKTIQVRLFSGRPRKRSSNSMKSRWVFLALPLHKINFNQLPKIVATKERLHGIPGENLAGVACLAKAMG